QDQVLPREEGRIPHKERVDTGRFCYLLDERCKHEQEHERVRHGQVEEDDKAHHLGHEDKRDREDGKQKERRIRVPLREDAGNELADPGQELLFGEEALFVEILCRDIEEYGSGQPEERGGIDVIRNRPGGSLDSEHDQRKRGDEADHVDVCKDAGEEEVRRSNGGKEDGDESEFLETPGEHPDDKGVCEKE